MGEFDELIKMGCSVTEFHIKTSRTTTSRFLLVGRMGMNFLFLWKKASDSKSAFTPGEKTWMENHRGQVDVTDSVRRIAMRVGLSELCQEK